MKLSHSSSQFYSKKGFVATVGTYDGVHLGHQKILQRVVALANKSQLESLVVTFEPQPFEYFQTPTVISRLSTLREKVNIFAKNNIANVLCLKFNHSLAKITATRFVEDLLLKKLNVKWLLVGEDFRFGHESEGDISFLKSFSKEILQVEVIATVTRHGLKISSTHIRQALRADNLKLAADLLGRNYSMIGRVGYGDHFGHVLGFPTANIYLRHKVLPLSGVYAVLVKGLAAEPLLGVANIGFRPTVNGVTNLLEVHLLDFDADIYGCKIEVEFLPKIRPEKKFENIEQLKIQIAKDVATVREMYAKVAKPLQLFD